MARKRADGEGTVYYSEQLGRWVGQVSLPNGKRKTKYGKTQKEVKDWILSQRDALQKGVWVEQDKVTLSEFLARYMTDVAAHTLRPKTIESYTYVIRNHITPDLGKVRLTALRPDHLQKLYSDKLASGLSPRTVHYIHAVLHKSLGHALKWGLVNRNVATLVDSPSQKKKEPTTWTAQEASRFLESVKESRFYPMYCLALCGLREGEILGLHIEDFNSQEQIVTIRHAVQYLVGKGLVITEPKTEKARRSVKLPGFAYEALKKHCDSLNKNQGLMFTTSNGTPFSPRNFFRDFKESSSKAGLPEIRFHDLRHTTVSILIGMGVPPSVVQSIVGHTSPLLTLSVYTHMTTSMQNEAAEKMNNLMQS